MVRFLLLGGLLICVGCASDPSLKESDKQPPLKLVERTEVFAVRVTQVPHEEYEVEALLGFVGEDGFQPSNVAEEYGFVDVDVAPRGTFQAGEWSEVQMVQRVGGFHPTVSWLIGGEMVRSGADAGVTLKVHQAQADPGRARIKGMLVRSKFNAERELDTRVFPFNSELALEEWTVIYEEAVRLYDSPRQPRP